MFLLVLPSAQAIFYPGDNISMEGVYNITNVSFIHADWYCDNSVPPICVKGGSGMGSWEIAVMFSFFATAALFAYFYNSINPTEDSERGIFNIWYVGFKLFFLLGSLLMSLVGIFSGLAMLSLNGISSTGDSGLSRFIMLGFQLDMWIIILFFFFIVVGGVVATIMSLMEKRRPKE